MTWHIPFFSLSRRGRFIFWIVVVAALLAGEALWIVLLRGRQILGSDRILIGGQMILCGLLVILMWLLKTKPPDAIRLSRRTSTAIILSAAASLQLLAVISLWPALSEDVIRYRMDGRTWRLGLSPYSVSPAKLLHDNALARKHNFDRVDAMVTHPHLRSIYPPVSQLVFFLIRGLESSLPGGSFRMDEASPPQWREHLKSLSFFERAAAWRTAFAALAVISTALLIGILNHANRGVWWAALFAWNPLVILETGGMGHQDIIGVTLLLLTIHAMQRQRFSVAAAALAAAMGVKPFALLLFPYFYREIRREHSFPAARRSVVVFITTIVVIFVPVMLYQQGYQGWLETGRMYALHWEANGSIYEIFKSIFGADQTGHAMVRAKEMARLFGTIAVLGTGMVLWRLRASMARAGYWLFLVMLLVSPVVYPWYLMWVLCLIPMLRGGQGWTGLVWSATAGISYLLWRQPDWSLRPIHLMWEYGPVYLALLCEIAILFGRKKEGKAGLAPTVIHHTP